MSQQFKYVSTSHPDQINFYVVKSVKCKNKSDFKSLSDQDHSKTRQRMVTKENTCGLETNMTRSRT